MTLRVANAPCSWGALEFSDALVGGGGGHAPNRPVDGPPTGTLGERILREMSAAGYAGTELGDWGLLPTTPEALGALLKATDLALVGAFVPVPWIAADAVDRGVRDALRVARLLAAVADRPFLILADENGAHPVRRGRAGRIRPSEGLAPDDLRRAVRAVERVAAEIGDETGLPVVFHHHGGGWFETPDEISRLLDGTAPEHLGLCLDTGHYALGGGDPVDALTRFAGRIPHVHLKDFDPGVVTRADAAGWDYFDLVREGVFPELGAGAVDFPALANRLRRDGYEGWVVVEQDVLPGMGTPLESARRNRATLRSLGW
ncbi:MAG: TIM barrel protein [Pseudomonadota bacterium]